MKTISYFIIVACTAASSVLAVPRGNRGGNVPSCGGVPPASPIASPVTTNPNTSIPAPAVPAIVPEPVTSGPETAEPEAATGEITRGAQTQVLFEIGGIPGNECLTFRNNGEIVDAACVNTAADRQLTPSTIGTQSVLLVQRSFSAGFRPDLVDVQACVGFNGTHFKALPCAGVTPVSLVEGQLKAGAACASGHDAKAQLTVDTTGATCAQFTTTDVAATAP